MAYTPNTWQSREGTGLNKFQDQDGNIYEFTAIPDQVTQPGTPFSADWMNHIEQGIANVDSNFPVSIANGGTGATTAQQARTNLGVSPANDPLFTPSPAYRSDTDSTEANFNNWLDSVLNDYMPTRQVRLIYYSCYPAIVGGSCLGILYKYTNDVAVMLSFSVHNQLFIKRKVAGTWQNTQTIFT